MATISAPSSHRRRESLLTSASTPLTLQILGGQYDGREIELNSNKVAIGSAAHCTLRLVGCGLRPVELLILRGPQGSWVQNGSRGNLINGRAFSEAIVSPGDRLSVGPLQFQVQACEQAEPTSDFTARLQVDRSDRHDQTVVLESSHQQALEAAELQIKVLQTELEGLQSERESSHTLRLHEQDQWIDELTKARQQVIGLWQELEQQATDSQESLNGQLQELQQQRDQLAQQAEQLQTEVTQLQDWQQRAQQAEAQLTEAQESKQQAESQWQQQQQALTLDLSEVHSQLDNLQNDQQNQTDREAQIDQLTSDLAESRNTIEQLQQQQSESQQHAAEKQFLQEQVAELESQANALREGTRTAQMALTEARERIEQLETEAVEHETSSGHAMTEDFDNSDSQPNERALAELLQMREQLDQREAELNQLERHLAEQESKLADREADSIESAAEASISNEIDDHDSIQNTIVLTGQENLAQEHANQLLGHAIDEQGPAKPIDTAADSHESDSNELVIPATEAASSNVSGQPSEETDQGDFFQVPRGEAPVSTADILAKYMNDNPDHEEQVSAEAHAEMTPPSTTASSAATTDAESLSDESPAEGDDTIREYMDQLMRRVRGESTQMPASEPTTQAPPEAPSEAAAVEHQPAAQAKAPLAFDVMSSDQFTPRSAAPEKTDNLAKMREVANSTARTAIDTASKTRRTQTAAIHCLMSLGAAIAGVSLISYATGGMALLCYATATVSLGAAAWWLYQAIRYGLGKQALPAKSILNLLGRSQSSKRSQQRVEEIVTEGPTAETPEQPITDAEELV